MIYTIYNTTTGEILCNTGSSKVPKLKDGESYLEGSSDDRTQMVSNGEVVARPSMNLSLNKTEGIADGVDEIVVSGIPDGAMANVRNGLQTLLYGSVDDGTLELASEYPVTMSVSLSLFPYLSEDFTVTFTESEEGTPENLLGDIL